jgi:hypothetical protein
VEVPSEESPLTSLCGFVCNSSDVCALQFPVTHNGINSFPSYAHILLVSRISSYNKVGVYSETHIVIDIILAIIFHDIA